ncbi:PPC domain-containing protein [Tumidithrix elongata RA019]|uniref:PPC domain-containing protein n=1 Tax=Tumidithrix elongata BACA0141 TaxID=2716417 RepID=A0AAW9PW98_9CYAN|nr:PPC domain-containing protein [Tumidithrix elongata RA019]
MSFSPFGHNPKLRIFLFTTACSILMYANVVVAQNRPNTYKPIPLEGNEVTDILTDKDIPTGQKGFARDYVIQAAKDDRLEISLTSDAFDTVVTLLGKDGDVIAENDDAASDTTNSLLFVKIRKAGTYVVRVQSFGGSSGGKFTLRVTKLRPVN